MAIYILCMYMAIFLVPDIQVSDVYYSLISVIVNTSSAQINTLSRNMNMSGNVGYYHDTLHIRC